MPINNLYTKQPAESRTSRSAYVFFCEGSTEAEFIKTIDQKRILVDAELIAVWMPVVQDENGVRWFTPKRILDYYLQMRYPDPNRYWPYMYHRPNEDRDRNVRAYDAIERANTSYYLLIDTDVFFKNINPDDYTNLRDDERNYFRQGGTRFLNNVFLNNNQEYTFLEQELNFEDFFVLFFMDDYEGWFEERFGVRANVVAIDRAYLGGELGNNNNGQIIKARFHEMTGIPDVGIWLNKNNINWVNCIARAQERMHNHQNYEDEDGNVGLSGWPFRFGLVNFLAEHMPQQGNEYESN